jgi:uncharacterized protein
LDGTSQHQPEEEETMQLGVIGATGRFGSRIVSEALSRGHRVTATSRDASHIEDSRKNVTWKSVDIDNAAAVTSVLSDVDVLVSAFGPGNELKDEAASIAQSIADPAAYPRAARALLTALNSYPRKRLIVIGGAASLEVKPGLVWSDSEELIFEATDQLGLPREYIGVIRAHENALKTFRTSNRLWTYVSPAVEIFPGERTGRFRYGGDQPVIDAEGRSRISFEDAAVAVVDEAELPRFVQRRFTVGY